MGKLRVAVVGCLHGQMADLYEAIEREDKAQKKVTNLVIVCGDVQVGLLQ